MQLNKRKINQPDFLFVKYCERSFKVNRGVYNAIDAWFYEQGEVNILERREKIIAFLQYYSEESEHKKKFGKGGLTASLREFLDYNQA